MSVNGVPPKVPPDDRPSFVTTKKILALTEEFPFCSQQFTAYLNSLSDNILVDQFHRSKDLMTQAGVFEMTSTVEQRYLQTARILFNRLTDSQKGDLSRPLSAENIEEYRRILGSGEFIGSGPETLALDRKTREMAEIYRRQLESPGVYCGICDKDTCFVTSKHYFEHMEEHTNVTLYGCHHCHLCLTSIEDYYNHECKGIKRAVRMKYLTQREFRIAQSMIACADCGFTQNIHQSLTRPSDQRQMELLQTLYTNHNCKNLLIVKVLTTDSVQRKTQDNWRAEFFLPLNSTFGEKMECCKEKFASRGKYQQHMYNHLPENVKMAAFIRSLHLQPATIDTRKDFIPEQGGQVGGVVVVDQVSGKFRRRARPLSTSLTFHSDNGNQLSGEDESRVGDIRPSSSSLCDPTASSDRILTITFLSFHDKEEICQPAGLDQTLVCKKCRIVCLDDVAAGIHFSTCSLDKEVSPGLCYNADTFYTLIYRNTLPIWPVRCLEPECSERSCSLEGYKAHMALSHGYIVPTVGNMHSTNKWPNCERQASTTEAINEFCGLTRDGRLRGVMGKQCHKPGSGVSDSRRRRRAGLFRRRDGLPMEETVVVVMPMEEEKKEDNVVIMEVDEGPAEETQEDASGLEVTATDTSSQFCSPVKRGCPEPTATRSPSRDIELVDMTDDDLNSTMALFRPPPVARTTTVVPDTAADETMAIFRAPPVPPSDRTIALDDTADETPQHIDHRSEEETLPLALQVAQMWNSSRISRESPVTPERRFDFGNRCFDCGFLLESSNALEEHLKHHERKFDCGLCVGKKTFKTSEDLMQHICNEHTKEGGEDEDELMCEFCERIFSPDVLVPHLLFDCNFAPCGICGEALQKKRHLDRERHRKDRKCHGDRYKRFRCNCKQSFTNYLLYRQHICPEAEVAFEMEPELFIGVVADAMADPRLYEYLQTIKAADVTLPAEDTTQAPPDTIIVVNHTDVEQPLTQATTPPPLLDILAAAQAELDFTPEKAPPSVVFIEPQVPEQPPPSVMILDPPPPAPTFTEPLSVLVLDPPPPAPVLDVSQQPPDQSISAVDLLNENIEEEEETIQEDSQSGSQENASAETSPAVTMDRTVSVEDDDEIEFLEVVKAPPKEDPDIVAVVVTSTANTSLSWNHEDGELQVADVPAGNRTTERTGREKKYKCTMCSDAFFTAKRLDEHQMERHSSDISKIDPLYTIEYGLPLNGFAYVCLLCNAAFERADRFNFHFNAHISIKTGLFQCEYCSGIQISSDTLGAHKEQHGYRINGSATEPKIRWRCTQCPTNIVFVDEGGYMLHLVQMHHVPMFYYCKACFKGSCTYTAMAEHSRENCEQKKGGVRGLGFVPANQINYQPYSEAEYTALVTQNPGMAVKLTSCTHRTFVRFGPKWTSCFEEEGCFGLINANRFEQHLRVKHNQFDDTELAAKYFPPTYYARPDYNIKNWLANNQITISVSDQPWKWPYHQPLLQGGGRRIPQSNAPGRPRATPPAAVGPPPAMNHPTTSGYRPNGRAMSQPSVVPMQLPPRYQQVQYAPAHMPGAPIPQRQIYQAPIPVAVDLMTCAVCQQAGVMLQKFMIPLPQNIEERRAYVIYVMQSVQGLITEQQTQEISNRMMQPEARLCWSHINPHTLITRNHELYVPPANVCLDYPKYTETLMANPQQYKQKLDSILISARSPSFNVCDAITCLKKDNICRNQGCVGRAELASKTQIDLHLAHFNHQRKHYCNMCQNFFNVDEMGMLEHIITSHFATARYTAYELSCPICTRIFKAEADFSYHMRTDHQTQLREVSKFCVSQHATRLAKEAHERRHNSVISQCCFICGLANPPTRNTRAGGFHELPHVLLHAMERSFTCRHCLLQFRQKWEFLSHIFTDHNARWFQGKATCCNTICNQMELPQHVIQTHMIIRYGLCNPEAAQRQATLTVQIDPEVYRGHLGLPQVPTTVYRA